jgi:hypothetical protein
MSELKLPRATISALRTRHAAFLLEQWTSDAARGEWIRSFHPAYEWLLTRRLRDVLDPDALVASLVRVVTAEALVGFASPIAREIHRRVIEALADERSRVGDYIPEDARAAIEALVSRKGSLPEGLVRQVFEHEATDDILRDVLYDALREFNDSVNPFFADWGLPALLKKLMPIGSGTVLKSLSALRGEFDKRLDPEMKKFLLAFSRKAKTKIADFIVARSTDAAPDPKAIALRRAILGFFYEQSLADVVARADDESRRQSDAAALAIALAIVSKESPRDRLRASLAELVERHGDDTVGEWLRAIGVSTPPDLEALAALSWPYVRLALESPPGRAWVERATWDFYATIATTD